MLPLAYGWGRLFYTVKIYLLRLLFYCMIILNFVYKIYKTKRKLLCKKY
jgi:hypothetical protein